MLGTVLANRYRIDSELGRGGMGAVYRGYDLRLNRPVAIKVVSNPGLGTEGRARLLSEAQAVAQLNHPNVVVVYDAIEADETPFIVMELIDGKTLRNIARPTLEESISHAYQVCAALVHAHEKGIIHRDLKPENVILTHTGTVKLMDFGLARSSTSPRITQTGALMGTMAYLAPELIQGADPSPQSDLYAFGVMLYEAVTGRAPFEGKEVYQLLGQHLFGQVTPPRHLRPDLPDELDTLILRLLSKDPRERPASAREVEMTLLALQGREDLPAPGWPTPTTEPSEQATLVRPAPTTDKRKKSYPKFSMPVLEIREKDLVFSSRARELERAAEHLKNHRLLLITGMPGIGKSTLARAVLEFMPQQAIPPFWYDFERQQSSGNTLGVLLDRLASYLEKYLGLEVFQELMAYRNSPEGQASAHEVDVLIDFLSQSLPLWLVFDNLDMVLTRGGNTFLDEGLELLFDGLRNNSHNARIIITSPFVPVLRRGEYLLEFGTKPLALQGLDDSAALASLRAHGLQGFPEPDLVSLAHSVDGHPFALNQLARYIEAIGSPDALDHFQGGLDDVARRFRASIHGRLSAGELTTLQSLTVLHREIPLEGLCKTADTTPNVIKRLRDEGLLETTESGKFWLPTVIRRAVQPEDPVLLTKAHARAGQYYRAQGLPVVRRGIDEYSSALEWHHHALQAGDLSSAYAALFSTGLANHLKQWNEFNLLLELCDSFLARLTPGQAVLSNREHITILQTRGILQFLLGKYTESITSFEAALDLLTEGEDPLLKMYLLTDLAESYNGQGQFSQALERCEQALSVFREQRSDWWFAKALQIRGIIQRNLGDLEQAIEDLEQARKIFEDIDNLTGIAYVTGELGIVYYYQNQFEQALENYRRATRSCEEKRDIRGALIGHFNVGDILLQSGQFEAAAEALETAYLTARQKKFRQIEIPGGLYLAEAQLALGRLDEAHETLDALHPAIAQQAFDGFTGHEVRLRASLHAGRGEAEAAQDFFERALEILHGEANTYERARAQLAYADFLTRQNKTARARNLLQEAQTGFTRLRNELGLRAATQALADLENEPGANPT